MKHHSLRKNLLPGSLKRHKTFWQHIKTVEDLAVLFRTPQHELQLLSLNPQYKEYRIPKKNGSFRQIEDPAPALKKVLRKVNHYLQAHYYFLRPTCVHGFCISPKHTENRNILSNAQAHANSTFLLNIDLKDFFHQVSEKRVGKILVRQFPLMNEELVDLLGRLCTRKGRLPMGAPTSPALSNFACLKMDAELEAVAYHCGWTYTRFADDLSFSADRPISVTDEYLIRPVLTRYGFMINEEKVRRYGADEEKIVTGLHIRNGEIFLPPNYLPQLEIEIARLRNVMLVEGRYQTGMSMRKLGLLKQELLGKLNFASQVLGSSAPEIVAREEQYASALTAKEDYESASWLDIPYSMI